MIIYNQLLWRDFFKNIRNLKMKIRDMLSSVGACQSTWKSSLDLEQVIQRMKNIVTWSWEVIVTKGKGIASTNMMIQQRTRVFWRPAGATQTSSVSSGSNPMINSSQLTLILWTGLEKKLWIKRNFSINKTLRWRIKLMTWMKL